MLSDTMMLGGGRKAAYPIDNSLLFRGAQYLTRTPAVVGDRKTFTFSCWFRRGITGVQQMLMAADNGAGTSRDFLDFSATDQLHFSIASGNDCSTEAVFRDTTAWYHVVLAVDTPQEEEEDRVKLYVNGDLHVLSVANYPLQHTECFVTDVFMHKLGMHPTLSSNFLSGYLSEPILVDGTALDPSYFGQIDPVTGSWRPKAVSGVDFGPNGFYLGKPWNAASLGTDASGRGNDWTPVGFAASDVMGDSPTNVYATLNPLDQNPSINVLTLSDGNLRCTWTNDDWAVASIWVTAGKWYWEWSCVSRPSYSQMPGITNRVSSIGRPVWSYNGFNGEIFNGSSYLGVSYGTWGAGDIIGMALDMDAGTLSWYKNGVLSTAISGLSGAYAPSVDGNDGVADLNFGQRPFAFTPPDGFQSLCTANLPATTGQTSGTFTGNANADGPCVFTGAVPETLSVNGNPVTWGTHADKLATGFKIRTASSAYNASGANSWVATYDKKPTVGPKNRAPANAQGNP